MRKYIVLLFFLYVVLALQGTNKNSVEIKYYGLDQGLSQGVISHIFQDKIGYMWFSTWDGLVCFDGYTFKTYKARPGDGNELTNSRFGETKEDIDGNLWSRDYRQAIVFERENNKFHNILLEAGITNLEKYYLKEIHVLKKQAVWLQYDNGNWFRINTQVTLGKDCEAFPPNNANLQGASLNQIFEDSKGNEWLLTNKGIFIYGKVSKPDGNSFIAATEWNSRIYLATSDGKFGYWNENYARFEEIHNNLHLGKISSLCQLDKSKLIITSFTNGAFIFDYNNKEIKQLKLPPNPDGYFNILSAFVDSEGDIWFEPSTAGTILYLTNSEKVIPIGTLNTIPPSEQSINFYKIVEVKSNHIWFYSKDRNLWCYDKKNEKLLSILEILNQKNTFLPTPSVRGFTFDKQGDLWVNTHYKGLYKISPIEEKCEIKIIPDAIEVRSLLTDNNKNLWIASKDKNIRIYDVQNNFLGYLSKTGTLTQGNDRLNTLVYSLYQDSKERIWIGSRFEGLYLLTPNKTNIFSYKITHYTHNTNDNFSLSANSIYSVCEDSKGRTWIATFSGGVNLVNPNSQSENLMFIHAKNNLKGYPLNLIPKVRSVKEVSEGILFIATTEGLAVLSDTANDVEKYKFSIFRRDAKNANSLSNNDVMDVLVTNTKEIYIATSGGGFDRVSIRKEGEKLDLNFRPFSQTEGLISDQSLSLIEDTEGMIWITSESALSRFYPQDNRIESFTSSYFHQKINFSEAHPVIDPKGMLIFGINEGFMRIDVEKMKKSDFIPPIGLTDLRIHSSKEQDKEMANIDFIDKLVLSPDERNITIQFAALDYETPHNIQYAYRLKGLEKNWNYVGNVRNAIYTNLPNGNYTFEVRSTNSDGVWVENVRKLPIEVTPRFIETFWAWLIIILAIIGLIVVGVIAYLTIYKLRHNVKMEEQLTQMKLRFFTDVSHELRTPLTLISSPLEEVIENEKLTPQADRNLRLIQKNVNRLLTLINQILDFRKIQNKRMRLSVENYDIVPILNSLSENFLLTADEKQIIFTNNFTNQEIYLWVDKDKFEKIIINLLSNAFKYTNKGKEIRLEVIQNDKEITISVIDQGIGIGKKQIESIFERFESLIRGGGSSSPAPSTGIGLSLVRNLVDLHHGRIEVSSEEEVGSCFSVHFLKGLEHFEKDDCVDILAHDSNLNLSTVTKEENMNLEQSVSKKTETTSILIVEDNEELRGFLVGILSPLYQVVEAVDGEDGIEKIYSDMPDVILSDVMMPKTDGLEMVKKIKEDTNICHIPIVLLSAKSSLDDRIKGLESGIDDYITKPFSAAYLKARIASILERRAQISSYYRENITVLEKNKPFDLTPEKPHIEPYDELFLQKLLELMEKEMDNSDLAIEDLSDALYVSRTVFYKKLKALTGYAPIDFVRSIRIKRAAQLIESGQFSVSEVAYKTGFNNPKYFSATFKKEYGVTPSDYYRKIKE